MHLDSKMLQNSIKHHFGSNGPRKSAFGYQNTLVSDRLEFIRVAKWSKTLPNIILGLIEAIGCVCAKTFVGPSIPRNSTLVYRNAPVSHRFACIRVAKCSKTLPNIILGLMEAIGCVRAKTFVGSLVPRNIAFGFRNTPVSHCFA